MGCAKRQMRGRWIFYLALQRHVVNPEMLAQLFNCICERRVARVATRRHQVTDQAVSVVLIDQTCISWIIRARRSPAHLSGEESIAELCRRDGIATSMHYGGRGIPRGR